MSTANPTELEKEITLLKDWIRSATEQTQQQINNIGHNLLFASLISLAATIGLQAVFDFLILWVPASFVLWLLWIIFWAPISVVRKYASADREVSFRKYDDLAHKKKRLGLATVGKRFAPYVIALVAVYIVTIAILILTKGGIIESDQTFSIWPPFATGLLLIVIILGGFLLFRRLSISGLDKVLESRKSRFTGLSLRRLLMLFGVLFIIAIAMIALYLAPPVWALVVTQELYSTSAHGLLLLFVLALQVLFFALFSGYLTHLYARTELSNYVVNLSNLDMRLSQIIGGAQTSAEEIATLKNQYYETIKYRFGRGLMLGMIPFYIPVLNEAYVQAQMREDNPRLDEEQAS